MGIRDTEGGKTWHFFALHRMVRFGSVWHSMGDIRDRRLDGWMDGWKKDWIVCLFFFLSLFQELGYFIIYISTYVTTYIRYLPTCLPTWNQRGGLHGTARHSVALVLFG